MTRAREWRILSFFSLLVVVLVSACGPGSSADIDSTPDQDPVPNLLIAAAGGVSLQREAWDHYVTVSLGTSVQRGDLIRPEEDQSAQVLCADLSVKSVTRESGCPCDVSAPVLLYDTARLRAPRADAAMVQIPYILYPRATEVLSDRPALRWNDTGAESYTVAIWQGSKTIWEQHGVQGNETPYPANQAALKPGVDYLVYVVDEETGRHSNEDPAKGRGFQVMDSEQRASIEVHRVEIDAQLSGGAANVDEPVRLFAVAVYYAGQGLRGDAWRLLEEEVSPALHFPAVQLWQGDLLSAMQLPAEAEAAYTAGLDAAEGVDLEAQAAAEVGLWNVTHDVKWRDAAIAHYEELGDQARADGLREQSSSGK